MAVFGEINSFLDFCARVKSWFGRNRPQVVDENPAERFIRLFDAHGINRNQIPRYFGQRLSLADVQSSESLLNVLDQNMIDHAAELFSVNPAWLECASPEVYVAHDFYKQPSKFLALLENLRSKGSDIQGMVYTSATQGSPHRPDTFILLEESFNTGGNEFLTRYHICNNWHFNYGKSRAYLIACVAAAWNQEIYVHGRKVDHEFISKYEEGQNLLGENIRNHSPGQHWHPEDLALDPEKFLDGFDSGYNRATALETLIKIQNRDSRFSLDNMTSVHRGVPFTEKLKLLVASENE